ncbi:B3 domain-containing transcription factor VRN1-like [Vicia villosa]|uniref:B3 domain-containing transcription factor VRN1-like n=1 Tax=Vicia villosa TaxID=3911 RepID=UPI00273CCBEB|nr:B3 domain-containing transcription factor VRN1-like [Vicia villosa]
MSITCIPRNTDTIRFFKIVTSTNIQDGNIRIPNAFTQKYIGNLSNIMFLKTPDNKKWEIHLTKKESDIWIHKGWKEFATHYSLDHGHMLIFQYEKTSHFEVHIFDKSTLEIEYPVYGKNQQEHNSTIENLNEQPSCNKTKPKPQISKISSSQPHKKLRIDTTEEVGTSSKLQNWPKLVQVKDEKDSSTECINVMHYPEQKNFTSKIEKALTKAKNYKSQNPLFIVVMTSSYSNQYMCVPFDFEQKYLKKDQSDMVLRVMDDDRTWIVKYSERRISSGWRTFASDNNLKVGDVCLFEMINYEAYAFRVLVFRVDDEQCSPPPRVHEDRVNSVNIARISKVESKPIILHRGMRATPINSLRASPCNFAKFEVKQFASSLKNPNFTVKLRSNHWNEYKPRIPNSFSRKYLCYQKKTVMLQFDEKIWPVELTCYPSDLTRKLSVGWSRFAEENKLQVGDVCVFELINKEDAVLDVRIFRGRN